MSKLAIVIGSVRTGRVADKVLGYVKEELNGRDDVDATIIDLAELPLPFYNNEQPAMSPERVLTDENVLAWSKHITDADQVLFITPEYNHNLTAVQKNAIDWLGTEWESKPITAVAYGWSGGSLAVAALRETLSTTKADVKLDIAQLGFMTDLNPDGTVIDETSVKTKIATALDEVLATETTAVAV